MKYFVMSDIHGFYKPMLSALRKAGFKKTDPNHTLIVCGDLFDRGPGNVEVYKYIKSIPKERRILIRGNHEHLLAAVVTRGFLASHDFHNGTDLTITQFLDWKFPGDKSAGIKEFGKMGIIDWIYGDEWVNFYEVDDYIFVHAWIPTRKQKFSGSLMIKENWRECSDAEWITASWQCPWEMYREYLVPDGKTIVCGHWHTSDFRAHLDGDFDSKDLSLYTNYNLVALDACTAWSGFCNVFTFEK